QHKAMLAENPGVLTERRGLVLPVVDLTDGDLEPVLRVRRGGRAQRQHASERHQMVTTHDLVLRVIRLRLMPEVLREVSPEALRELRFDALLEVAPRDGSRPASASRIDQYSQVRPTTLGIAL